MLMDSSKDAIKDVVHNFLKTNLFLTVLIHNRITRQMKMVRIDLAKISFYYNGSVIFNKLNF